jgi:hypothetical protein
VAAAVAVVGMPPRREAGSGGSRDAAVADLEFWCRTELEICSGAQMCCLGGFPRRSSGTASAELAGLTGGENFARIFVANHSALGRTI